MEHYDTSKISISYDISDIPNVQKHLYRNFYDESAEEENLIGS